MTTKKDTSQYLIICAESLSDARHLLGVAVPLAASLRHKGLILLSCASDADSWIGEAGIPYVALRCPWREALGALHSTFHGILALAVRNPHASRRSITHPATLLRTFRDCRIAYLTIPAVNGTAPRLDTVALTLDHSRESKEKVIWASYFARFVGARVTFYHHCYSDPLLLTRFQNNTRYIDKIFTAQGLTFALTELPAEQRGFFLRARLAQFSNPDPAALAATEGLFIMQTSDPRERGLAALLPPPERHLLDRKNPILILNRRDDLYILCD